MRRGANGNVWQCWALAGVYIGTRWLSSITSTSHVNSCTGICDSDSTLQWVGIVLYFIFISGKTPTAPVLLMIFKSSISSSQIFLHVLIHFHLISPWHGWLQRSWRCGVASRAARWPSAWRCCGATTRIRTRPARCSRSSGSGSAKASAPSGITSCTRERRGRGEDGEDGGINNIYTQSYVYIYIYIHIYIYICICICICMSMTA